MRLEKEKLRSIQFTILDNTFAYLCPLSLLNHKEELISSFRWFHCMIPNFQFKNFFLEF